MVFQKKLDNGSSGNQVPSMPYVPRSAKGKRSARKKVEDNQMYAFDLLATVAENLLEGENNVSGTFNPTSVKDTVEDEQLDKEKQVKVEAFDHRSCDMDRVSSKAGIQRTSKEYSQTPNKVAGHASKFTPSDKDYFDGKSIITGMHGEPEYSLGPVPKKCSIERCSPGSVRSYDCKLQCAIKSPLQAELRVSGNMIDGSAPGTCSLEDPMDLDTKPPALVSSDSSVEVPLRTNHIACNSSFPMFGDSMEHFVDKDDDENTSGCTHPSTITSKVYRPQRIGDRRIRKLLASKFWKVAPTMLKDGELSDTEMKPTFRGRKMCYTRQRTQRSLFKKRKLLERRTILASDGGICREGISNLPAKGSIKVEENDLPGSLIGANGASSALTIGQNSSNESENFHVKFSIKSFKVPELFIEIPETATVASLKRTVLEAVTAILGGGPRVGVLLQGKKVRDDSKTLLQAGIAHADKLESLSFTLDPNPSQAIPSLTCPEEKPNFPPTCDDTKLLTGNPVASPPTDPSDATLQPPLAPALHCSESDHDSVHSPTDVSSLGKVAVNSKALVAVPSMSTDPLSMIPLRKPRRPDLVQRRIRRPFSVAEVEALVQAVEKLGTGRWRDVKIRSFDSAKHRTYVDLKDKWKTLVHTARISPQQRRGEPVPQDLLDRVLAAHAYWTQQQAKLQVKPPPAGACLLV